METMASTNCCSADGGAQPVAFADRNLQFARQAADIDTQAVRGLAFQGQKAREFADFTLQLAQRLVAPGQRLTEKDLGHDEDQQQEDNDHQQRRQGIDEAGPDVGRSFVAPGETGHGHLVPCRVAAGM